MLATVAATTVGLLPVFLTGTLAVQIGRDLTLPTSRLGIAVAAFFGSSALCSAGLGRLSDRVGGTTMMRWGIAPTVVALMVIGLGVHRFAGLVVALALAGVANGAIQPTTNRYLTRTVGTRRQGLAFGVKQAAIPAATLLSGLAVPVVAHTAGWRSAYVGAAVLAVAVGVLIRGGSDQAARTASSTAPGTAAKRPAFARPALITLAVGVGMGSAAMNAMGSFFVLSAVSIDVTDARAGLVAAVGSAASLLVRLGIGLRADRRSVGHLRLVSMLCAGGSTGVLLLALGEPRLLLLAAIIGYGAGWGWAGLFNFAVVGSHPAAPGRATGLTQVGANTGGCLGPLCFGFTAAHVGYPPAWIGAAVFLLAAALVILAGRRALHTAGVISGSGHGAPTNR
jgi:MFS family permease